MVARYRILLIGFAAASLSFACGSANTAGGDCTSSPDFGAACTAGEGACTSSGTMTCDADGNLVCDARPGNPGDELCGNGADDDCDGATDEGFEELGNACTIGQGLCLAQGVFFCAADGTAGCDAPVIEPAAVDMCDGRDEDCDGVVDGQCAYRSCAEALARGETADGVYDLSPDGIQPAVPVYCDMTTDGGGWTLVASTRTAPLDDQASNAYADLATLAPTQENAGIWDGMRVFGPTMDVRVSCRATLAAADQPFDVDLAFYGSGWYDEWTTGADAESCFSEGDGAGADAPGARWNYLNGVVKYPNQQWAAGYLEGEDSCDAEDDFTIDLADRGMAGNPDDGTDWGEADGVAKCGVSGVDGQWFVWVRPTTPDPVLKVAIIGSSGLTPFLLQEGIDVTELPYGPITPNNLVTGGYNVVIIGRYAYRWSVMTAELASALDLFNQAGGHVITEWDGISSFFSGYHPTFRYAAGAYPAFGWFAGQIGAGQFYATGTPVTQVLPEDPIFEGVANPISGVGGTEYFYTVYNHDPAQLEVLATFEGNGSANYPAGSLATVLRGLRCGGNVIFASFDYQDEPDSGNLLPFVLNLPYAATYWPNGRVVDVCPF